MKTYKKRIGFLISDQHFIPHGGIGQFAKGFADMCNLLNWKLDVFLDKKPTNDKFVELFNSLGANLIYPDESLRYTDHVATFAFSDSVNFEKIINFRKSILKGFERNLYDAFVCNTQESMSAAHAMALSKDIPVIFYTHLHSMIFRDGSYNDVFLENYHLFYNKHMELADIFVGTQSHKNREALLNLGAKNANVLPIPMPERELLEENNKERKGVLFIGRWEEGKNPEAYIRVMKECGLPCKVMTSENGVKKFEKAFKEAGITNYEIKASITGKEKVDFIKGSRVHFNPSKRESYGIAFMECIGHMPCVVLDTQDWSENFESVFYYKTSLEDAASTIKALYSNTTTDDFYKTNSLKYAKTLDEIAITSWEGFINGYQGRKATSNQAKINTFDQVKYKDYITGLERKHLAREDFESVLTNRHKFTVIYTDNNTYLSKDKDYVPTEDEDNNGEPILVL